MAESWVGSGSERGSTPPSRPGSPVLAAAGGQVEPAVDVAPGSPGATAGEGGVLALDSLSMLFSRHFRELAQAGGGSRSKLASTEGHGAPSLLSLLQTAGRGSRRHRDRARANAVAPSKAGGADSGVLQDEGSEAAQSRSMDIVGSPGAVEAAHEESPMQPGAGPDAALHSHPAAAGACPGQVEETEAATGSAAQGPDGEGGAEEQGKDEQDAAAADAGEEGCAASAGGEWGRQTGMRQSTSCMTFRSSSLDGNKQQREGEGRRAEEEPQEECLSNNALFSSVFGEKLALGRPSGAVGCRSPVF